MIVGRNFEDYSALVLKLESANSWRGKKVQVFGGNEVFNLNEITKQARDFFTFSCSASDSKSIGQLEIEIEAIEKAVSHFKALDKEFGRGCFKKISHTFARIHRVKDDITSMENLLEIQRGKLFEKKLDCQFQEYLHEIEILIDSSDCNRTVLENFFGKNFIFVNPKILELSGINSHFDEAKILYSIVENLVKDSPFDIVLDCFSRAGHISIPMLKSRFAKRGIFEDIDSKALTFLNENIELNGIRSWSMIIETYDINTSRFPKIISGKTLFVANPPFSKKMIKSYLEQTEDSDEDGLGLSAKTIEKVFDVAKRGDVFIGLSYSLMWVDQNEKITWSKLKDFLLLSTSKKKNCHVRVKVVLLKSQSLSCCGGDGVKEWQNSMVSSDNSLARADGEGKKRVNSLGYFYYIVQF